MTKTLYTHFLQSIVISSVLALALGINYLSAWTGPTALPPGNNTAAPLNIGTTNQVKDANLSVGHSANTATDYGLVSYGRVRSTIGGFEFPDGTVQASAGGAPSGMYAPFRGPTCPSGWVAADGSNGTVDLRGQFVRAWSNGSAVDAGRVLGSAQGDAIRNITGDIGPIDGTYTGVFVADYGIGWGATLNSHGDPAVKFDASRVVPTANEDRPVNVALLYCMKS